jgi:hypothetical protein
MRLIPALLVAVALAAAPTPTVAQAAPPDDAEGLLLGGTLEDMCRAKSGPGYLSCTSYLRGSLDGLLLGQGSITAGETSFCLPEDGVAISDLRDAFLHFVAEDDARRSDIAGILLLESLEENFPCEEPEAEPEGPSLAPNVASASTPARGG